ncbi:hypothetical protein H257_17150 [Aphanomyces astaci]|uniref:Dihydrolipoamide acetyltransferase component of pyruvate dehydrogenase complex n=1 Tax=Aphanomyces astaci TaxID=112090 RepID=W4FFZ0_APHAT|nr:hypothetical protein H257_17150 [Aphanomyces astaci]ETV66360.1 hypothetical protein H257_17150 [Aphanomyces astaci]|eukprot:XP_009844135.1 hypothetical protein H257_17150 [Aphanomyces astaci]
MTVKCSKSFKSMSHLTLLRTAVRKATLAKHHFSRHGMPIRMFSSADHLVVKVPSMGDSISEGTVVSITKNIGDYVHIDEPVVVLETDKVSVDVNAPQGGVIKSFLAQLEDTVVVGAPLYTLDTTAPAPAVVAKPAAPAAATPVITKAVEQPKAVAAPPAAAPKAAVPATPTAAPGKFSRNETRVKLSHLQVRANQRLKDTQNTAALLSTFQECDVSALLAMQKDLGATFEKTHKVKLGFLSAFVKASALALKVVPAVNATIDMDNKDIVYHDYADINVVVATDKGLVSPVVRNCESISLVDIERSLATLGAQAQDGTLAIEDLAGGTFAITNGHVQGSLVSTNMLLSPHAAILSLHGVQNRPVFHDGKVVSRPMMYLSLSYDHRLIDGREGVTFLKTVADLISDPRRMLLHV